MAVKKREESKVVARYVEGTYFDVKQVLKKEGYGKARSVKNSSFGVFHTKHSLKQGFKSIDDAIAFAVAIFPTYNKKRRSFREPK